MPVIHVNVWEGWGAQKAKAAIQGITHVFVELGVPEQAVEVIVHEVPKSHWGIGGQPASERFGRPALREIDGEGKAGGPEQV